MVDKRPWAGVMKRDMKGGYIDVKYSLSRSCYRPLFLSGYLFFIFLPLPLSLISFSPPLTNSLPIPAFLYFPSLFFLISLPLFPCLTSSLFPLVLFFIPPSLSFTRVLSCLSFILSLVHSSFPSPSFFFSFRPFRPTLFRCGISLTNKTIITSYTCSLN